jgi:uncharacterized membrane protein
MVSYYTGTEAVIDSYNLFDRDINDKYLLIEQIFNSSELENTKQLLKELNVTYIYIDGEIRQKHSFPSKNQGLFYLLRNRETFKNIYTQDGVEIWEVNVAEPVQQ